MLTPIAPVFDWDRVSASDPLGGCRINVLDIEPFSAKLQSLPVLGPGGQQQGTLNVSLIFTPGVSSLIAGC